MLTKIWNDFCDDVLTSKKKKSKEKDFEKGPVKDFLTNTQYNSQLQIIMLISLCSCKTRKNLK